MKNSCRVIFVTSFKGGVGKTTSTANIASAVYALGKKVLVVDGDFGMRCMDIVLGYESSSVFNCYDVIMGRCESDKAILDNDGLKFLPAPMFYENDRIPQENFFKFFKEMRAQFDYIFIDSSAELSPYYISFAKAADEAIIVCHHQSSAVRAAEKTAMKLDELGFTNIRLIINGYKKEYAQKGFLPSAQEIIERSAVRLIGIVPYDEYLPLDQESGYVTFSGKKGQRLRKYEAAFANIAARITGESVPLFHNVYRPKKKKSYEIENYESEDTKK